VGAPDEQGDSGQQVEQYLHQCLAAARGRLHDGSEMRERRRYPARGFRGIVPAPQRDRTQGSRLSCERCSGRCIVAAALQRQASLRIRRQRVVIVGLGGAEVALGIDVQPDRLEDVVVEQRAQERQRRILMYVVDAALGRRFTLVVDQMAQVVQQRSSPKRLCQQWR
jgi:hypothetical protein